MTVDAAPPPAQSTSHAETHHLAWRWRVYTILLVVGIFGFWCFLVISSFWTLPSNQVVLVAALTLGLADVCGFLLYQMLAVLRLEVTPQGIRYKGVGSNIWSPWANVAGVDRRLLGSFNYTGLRLRRPALRASWIFGFERVQDPLLLGGITYTPDGRPGGGMVPSDPDESDLSLPGLPNDFIPLQAFQPDWQYESLGDAVKRYAPWVVGSTDPSQAQPGGPPPDSRVRRFVILAICALILTAEVRLSILAHAIWAAGDPFNRTSAPIIACVDACTESNKITDVMVGGGRVTAVSDRATETVVRAANGSRIARYRLGDFVAAAASPDGRYLAGGNNSGAVRLMDLRTHRAWTVVLPAGSIKAVAISANDHVLAAAGGDSTVRFLRVRDGHTFGSVQLRDTSDVETLAISPDGRWAIVTEENGMVQAFSVSLHPKTTLYDDSFGATYAAFAPNESYYSIGTVDGVVHAYSLYNDTQQIVNTDDVASIAFSPDGKLVVAGTDSGHVHVWRLSDGTVHGV